jgi:beta-lactamase class A
MVQDLSLPVIPLFLLLLHRVSTSASRNESSGSLVDSLRLQKTLETRVEHQGGLRGGRPVNDDSDEDHGVSVTDDERIENLVKTVKELTDVVKRLVQDHEYLRQMLENINGSCQSMSSSMMYSRDNGGGV